MLRSFVCSPSSPSLRLSLALTCSAFCLVLSSALADGPAPARTGKGAEIKLHETIVFRLWVDRPLQPAAARARAASQALLHAFEAGYDEVRVDPHAEASVIFVGPIPVVELHEADARAAESVSLDVYCANVVAKMRVALAAERRRSAIAGTVFSISLVVFCGFIALLALRKLGEAARRARDTIIERPERIVPIRFNTMQVIGAGPLRALLLAAVLIGRWVLQIGVVYLWLILALWRFAATRPYVARLNQSLIDPLSSLAQRTLSALPILVLIFALTAAVIVVVRFVELFFAGVGRGRERVLWLPRDLAGAASALIRASIVVLAIVFAGPIVSGDPEGVLARLGHGVLLGLALALTPLFCSMVCGTMLLFTRRVQVGRQMELGGQSGRVLSVGLLDVLLRDAQGGEVRVPHLRSLLMPLRVVANEPRLSVSVCVSPEIDPAAVIELLAASARTPGGVDNVEVELEHIDADGASYRVNVPLRDERTPGSLRLALVQALLRERMPLGRGSQRPSSRQGSGARG